MSLSFTDAAMTYLGQQIGANNKVPAGQSFLIAIAIMEAEGDDSLFLIKGTYSNGTVSNLDRTFAEITAASGNDKVIVLKLTEGSSYYYLPCAKIDGSSIIFADDIESGLKVTLSSADAVTVSTAGGGFTPVVLTCTVDFADATETDSWMQVDTTLTSGTYAAALAAAEAGTPAVLKITLQETADGTTTPGGEVDLFLQTADGSGLSGGLQLGGALTTATVAADGSVLFEMIDADGESDIFWVDAQMDLQTMTATVDSGTYAAVQAAIEAGKLVVGRASAYMSTTQKQLTYMLMDGSFDPDIGYVLLSANLRANFGSGTYVYYIRFVLNSDDTGGIGIELVSTTKIQ